jgi:GT2 family glycosyltransferase
LTVDGEALPAPPAPIISVVIPCRNGLPLLHEQLDALARQVDAPPFEVIVADNGSTDGTAHAIVARRAGPVVRVVDASEVRGVSHARNVGVRAARASRIAICDADDVVGGAWVGSMYEALETADIVGGPIRTDRLNDPVTARWRSVGEGALHDGAFLAYARGGNCAFRREAFEAVGGYDEGLVGGGDDPDFSWRLQLAGWSIGGASEAVVHYRLRPDLRSLWRQTTTYGRSLAELYARFGVHGMPEPWSARALATRTWWLITRAPISVVDPVRRGRWVNQLAWLVGIIQGAVESRRRRHHDLRFERRS